jgi:hypothetical protein
MRLTSGNNIAVLDHDALGGSGGSRGVHDAGQIIGLGRYGLGRVVLAQLDKLVEAQDLEVGVCLGEGINVLLLGVVLCAVDDDLDILCLLERVDELGQQLWVGEHDLGVGLEHRVAETLLAEGVVGSNDGKRLRQCTVSRGQPLVAGGREQVQAVVGLEAEVPQG